MAGSQRLTVPVRAVGGQSLIALRFVTGLPGVSVERQAGTLTLRREGLSAALPLDLAQLLPWAPQPEFPGVVRR